MEEYVELVARISFRILCDHSDSCHVSRTVFESFTKEHPECDGLISLHQWFISRTVRFSRKRFRYNRFMNLLGKRQKLYVQTAPKVDDADDYVTTQAWEIYCRASESLGIDQRIVYVLSELEGMSEDEVMLATGFWRGTVRMALEIARGNMKHELGKFGKVAEYGAYIGFLRRVKDSQASCPLTLNSLYLQA